MHDYPSHITAKGYRRLYIPSGSQGGRPRQVMEHVWVWEQAHGPVPAGHDIHHRDDDKLNNALENLQCVTKLEHKRIHSGCELRDGEWWKPCPICHQMKPITAEHWYFINGNPSYGRCRPCRIRQVVEAKRLRRAAAASA